MFTLLNCNQHLLAFLLLRHANTLLFLPQRKRWVCEVILQRVCGQTGRCGTAPIPHVHIESDVEVHQGAGGQWTHWGLGAGGMRGGLGLICNHLGSGMKRHGLVFLVAGATVKGRLCLTDVVAVVSCCEKTLLFWEYGGERHKRGIFDVHLKREIETEEGTIMKKRVCVRCLCHTVVYDCNN